MAELGAQHRDVSQTICTFSQEVVLVDVSRKVSHHVEQKSRAMRRLGLEELHLASHDTFCEIDSLEQSRYALFSKQHIHSYTYQRHLW